MCNLTAHVLNYRVYLGMTESSPGVVSTVGTDCMPGSSGPILPGVKCKILDVEGKEVTEYETPGELYVQGPNICLGYLNNPKATAETFVYHADGRWLRTGDEVVVRLSPGGAEHLVIVDRIKELIKVKVGAFLPELSSTLQASVFNEISTLI